MLGDVTWRKLPIDILTNENMSYIESQMPEGFEYAPFMFYQAALKKAGDDGEFDLEDGVIFARLMRVPNVQIVFQVANLMAQRRMIYHVCAGSNKCLLADWEYSNKTAPRTLAQRRQIVAQQIEAKKAMLIINEEFKPLHKENSVPSFICPDDDKNAKNVVINVNDDKNSKNVTIKNDTEREREKREREERECVYTHTERERESLREGERTEASASAEALNGPAPAPAEKDTPMGRKTKKSEPKTEDQEHSDLQTDVDALSSEALQIGETKAVGKFQEVESVLEAFFLANSFGYNTKKGRPMIQELAKRVSELADKTGVEAAKLCQNLCDIFKSMHDSEGTWKNIPLVPAYMAKDSVWAYILGLAGKKYSKGKKKNTFLDTAKAYTDAANSEREELLNQTADEYKQYGIEPDDPNRFMKLMKAKQQVHPEPQYEGDIF